MWTGLILAGGLSRRMGRDKAVLQIGGRTLLQRAVETIRAAGGEPLVIGRPRPECEVAGASQTDEAPSAGAPAGPLAALRHGLAVCGTSRALALACDLPLVPSEMARCLIARAERCDAVVPRAAGMLQVLAAAYTRGCLPEFDRRLAGGSSSIHECLGGVALEVLEGADLEPFGGPEIFLNVNTPEDLLRAEAILKEGRG
jgi:molybdopterin-guanine dinucleotide biosynthesis protein A